MIFLCSHPYQAIIVEENPKRVAGRDQDVNTQVKFVALHQKGFVQVLLYNEVVLCREFFTIPNQRYTARENVYEFF